MVFLNSFDRERGINVTKMKTEDMRVVLQGIVKIKTKVETKPQENNSKGYFIPKFHCKLNPIEKVWRKIKSIPRLTIIVHLRG